MFILLTDYMEVFIYFYFHFVGFSLLKIFTKKFHCIYFFLLWVHVGWMSEFMPPHAGGGQRTIYINTVGIWNQTQIVRIGGSHIYLLNYLTGSVPLLPLFVLFYIKFCLHDVISCSEVSNPIFTSLLMCHYYLLLKLIFHK